MKNRYIPYFLIAVGLIVWQGALGASFVIDDRMYILGNPKVHALANFIDLSGTRYVGFLSFALNYAFGGASPFGFHLVNVFIHIANSILVFFLVQISFNLALSGKGEGEAENPGNWATATALLASAIFLCHPLQTQAVSYITQRFASLATLFYLASLLFYIKARLGAALTREGDGGGKGFRLFYLLAFICAVLAMKTKEISFTLPFVLVVYDYIFLKGSREYRFFRIPFILTLLIIPLTLAYHVPSAENWLEAGIRSAKIDEATSLSAAHYFLTELRVITKYIGLFFYPASQQFYYDFPLSKTIFEIKTLLSFFFLLSLAGLSSFILYRTRKGSSPYARLFSFGIFFFFLTLSVESSVMPIKDVIFEHRVYLPGFGLITAFSAALAFLLSRQKRRSPLLTIFVAVLIICVPLSVLLYKRNLIWADELVLATEEVGSSPNKAVVHYLRGLVYLERGAYELSEADNAMAVRLNPEHHEAYNNRGIARAMLGRYEEAIEDFEMAIGIEPKHFKARLNKALTSVNLGNFEAALADISVAEGMRPLQTRAFAASEPMSALKDACLADKLSGCSKVYPEAFREP